MKRAVLTLCLSAAFAGVSPVEAQPRLPDKWTEEAFLVNQREVVRSFIVQRSNSLEHDHT